MQDTSLLTSQGPLTVSVSGHKKTASEGQTVLQEFCMIADNFFRYTAVGDAVCTAVCTYSGDRIAPCVNMCTILMWASESTVCDHA